MDVKEDREVPLRVINVSNEAYHLAAETVAALAKPVVDVTLLELYEENNESVVGQASSMYHTNKLKELYQNPYRNFLEGALSI